MAFNWIIDALATAIDCSLSLSLLFLFFSRNNFVSPWLIRLYCLSACLKKERKKAHTHTVRDYLSYCLLADCPTMDTRQQQTAGWLAFLCLLAFFPSFLLFISFSSSSYAFSRAAAALEQLWGNLRSGKLLEKLAVFFLLSQCLLTVCSPASQPASSSYYTDWFCRTHTHSYNHSLMCPCTSSSSSSALKRREHYSTTFPLTAAAVAGSFSLSLSHSPTQ